MSELEMWMAQAEQEAWISAHMALIDEYHWAASAAHSAICTVGAPENAFRKAANKKEAAKLAIEDHVRKLFR